MNRAPPLMLYPVLSGGPCLKKMSSTIRIATQGCTAIITNVLVCVQQLFLYQHCLQVFNKIKTFLFSVPGSFLFSFLSWCQKRHPVPLLKISVEIGIVTTLQLLKKLNPQTESVFHSQN